MYKEISITYLRNKDLEYKKTLIWAARMYNESLEEIKTKGIEKLNKYEEAVEIWITSMEKFDIIHYLVTNEESLELHIKKGLFKYILWLINSGSSSSDIFDVSEINEHLWIKKSDNTYFNDMVVMCHIICSKKYWKAIYVAKLLDFILYKNRIDRIKHELIAHIKFDRENFFYFYDVEEYEQKKDEHKWLQKYQSIWYIEESFIINIAEGLKYDKSKKTIYNWEQVLQLREANNSERFVECLLENYWELCTYHIIERYYASKYDNKIKSWSTLISEIIRSYYDNLNSSSDLKFMRDYITVERWEWYKIS